MNSVNPLFGGQGLPRQPGALRQVTRTVTQRRHLGVAETPPPGLDDVAKVVQMCGRYASSRSRIELLEEFAVERDRVDEPLKADYNVAPTKPVYAVMTRKPRPDAGAAATRSDVTRSDATR